MKVRSLKNMAFLFAMATMTVSGAAFAHHSHHHDHHSISDGIFFAELSPKQKNIAKNLAADLHIIISAQNTVFDAEGNSPNPNPASNDVIAGIVLTKLAVIAAVGQDFFNILGRQLGVHHSFINNISPTLQNFITNSFAYSVAVNTANLGLPPVGDQTALAAAMLADASSIGQAFTSLTGNPIYVGLFEKIAINETELVQAYRAVLDDANTFGAEPGVPITEGTATTAILIDLHRTARQIARQLVIDLGG